MIGDSGRAIDAAANAYIETICVITGGWSKQELRDCGAVAVFESLVDLRDHLDETRPRRRATLHRSIRSSGPWGTVWPWTSGRHRFGGRYDDGGSRGGWFPSGTSTLRARLLDARSQRRHQVVYLARPSISAVARRLAPFASPRSPCEDPFRRCPRTVRASRRSCCAR